MLILYEFTEKCNVDIYFYYIFITIENTKLQKV